MRRLYCIWTVLALLGSGGGPVEGGAPDSRAAIVGSGARLQGPRTAVPARQAVRSPGEQPQATPESTGYTVFLRGSPVGREDVSVRVGPEGTTVTSQGRLSAPFNAITRLAEFRYAPDWTTQLFALDGTINGAPVTIKTTFTDGTATSSGVQGQEPVNASHQVDSKTIILPNGVFSSYAALARRLMSVAEGDQLRAYVLPLVEIGVRVAGVSTDQMQLGNEILTVRRYDLTFQNPNGDLAATLLATESGSLIRVNVASQGLDLVRDDVAASTSRTQVHSNPGDEPVTIPATGFNLGATLTRPQAGPARLPAVVLVSGATVGDREGFALGAPIFGQMAGVLAEAGFLVVRYDKRGHGQSGGRSESATISDHADDVRVVFKWLEDRKDVDPKRIAVLGHDDGAWVALLAADRERRIAAVVSIAAASTPGMERNLEQQQLALDRSALPADERARRIALQKQIQGAVLTGEGWDGVPAELRRQADTPWFASFLRFDPAEVIEDVRQPLLFVHGALDRQVPPAHVERLAELAKTSSDSKAVEVVVVRGVNHLLLPASTGDVAEYATLTDRGISKDVTTSIADWLSRTFAAIR